MSRPSDGTPDALDVWARYRTDGALDASKTRTRDEREDFERLLREVRTMILDGLTRARTRFTRSMGRERLGDVFVRRTRARSGRKRRENARTREMSLEGEPPRASEARATTRTARVGRLEDARLWNRALGCRVNLKTRTVD